MEKILLDACLATPKIILDKSPSSRLNRIDDWFAEYKIVYKIENYTDRYKIKQQLWKNIWQHMDYANLQFAKHPMQQTISSVASKVPLNLNELTLRVIKNTPLLNALSPNQQAELIKKTHIQNFDIGNQLCVEGDTNTSLFIILEGAISINKTVNDTQIEINRLGAGDIIGEMSLLTGETRQATITALSTTKAVTITKNDIAPLLRENPELVTTLSELIAKRQKSNQSIQEQLDVNNIKKKNSLISSITNKMKSWFNLS